MSMTSDERTDLGTRIREQRERVFGTKSAAYTEAGVNSATWDKAEAGGSVRGDLLRRIVRTLWPESNGDWTRVVGGSVQGDYVAAPGEPATVTLTEAELEGIIRRAVEEARRLDRP